jgi:NAD(P)H-hydrate repair Nnr-like enzyme with NAD(P)H-hydrate epimerase domain
MTAAKKASTAAKAEAGPGVDAYLASLPEPADLRDPRARARVIEAVTPVTDFADLDLGSVGANTFSAVIDAIMTAGEAAYGREPFNEWIRSVPIPLQEDALVAAISRVLDLGKGLA